MPRRSLSPDSQEVGSGPHPMKATLLVILLALSLAANAALYYQRSVAARPTPVASALSDTTGAAGTSSATAAGAAVTASKEEMAKLATLWTQLQSGDPKTMVARLRAAGFSPAMIRAIIGAQVSEQFAARRKALLAQQPENPYWKSRMHSPIDPKTMSELRDLGREQNNVLKDLLGPDNVPGSEEMQAYQRRQFGDLPREKLDQMQSIVSDYSDLRNQVYSAANGVMLPEDREKLALLEKEQHADLAALLSPQELENYELRSSPTANQLRSLLAGFDPTEDEFRAIFRATRAAEEQYGSISTGGGNPNLYRQIQTAALAQAQASLTPERYAELKQATDPQYSMASRLAARLELPSSAATALVAVQQDTLKRIGALRSDQSLTPADRSAQTNAIAQEAEAKLLNVLGGTRGLEAYKQFGGQWLQNVLPKTPPGPPKG